MPKKKLVSVKPPSAFQPTLFEDERPSFDPAMRGLERVWLDATAWLDWLPNWVQGADALFDSLRTKRTWAQRERLIHGQMVIEPRLTDQWREGTGALEPALVDDLRKTLGQHYGLTFDSVGFNYYRDGRDSVAWHRDHISREIVEPIVALVSLGEPRKFMLRPHGGGGSSKTFMMGRGDLLVTGGQSQRTWEHTIPKVAHAGPRMSLAFRHGLDPRAYR